MSDRAERFAGIMSAMALAAMVAVTSATPVSAQRHGGHYHGEPEYVEEELVPYRPAPRLLIGGGLGMIVPQGDFGHVVGEGFSTTGFLVVGLEPSNSAAIRFEGSFSNYGSETITVPVFPTTGRIGADVRTSNNIGTFGVGPQFQVSTGPIRPYVNGYVGMAYFFTNSYATDGCCAYGSTLNYDDWSFGYGFGGGLGIQLGRGSNVVLNMDVQYRMHDDVQYLREGSIVDDGFGGVFVTPIISDADFLTFQMGLAFGL